MTLINKMEQFENAPVQNVLEFNKIFVGNEITSGNLADEVEIGTILGPANVRELKVGTELITHSFEITNACREAQDELGKLFEQGARPMYKLDRRAGTSLRTQQDIATNENIENMVLEQKEMEMDPMEYLLLQYFRGSVSSYHTQLEVATRLKKSVRGVRNILRRMEEGKIIKMKVVPSLHRMLVTINEDWL